ncbi:transcription factor VOZ1 [Salvia miltiorrhiza]|uniref:transcription factor VOZ1 n=1 Tax=Salvia miltiorrhiza TaxID=226208 RepID=UPI0025AD26BB|nr:transcription factor VOZ1 [Salvia miltiorrhiza]XP_057764416.1 transcription factor VOZ1 [Salvia miltiorrhiza]XP_057764417.1 transcription factor VOZ1 [Salvia miltiorrhiza]XP_057764418.1 transcription factor VOZ1 [Salvia miltiorrhiza]
MGKGSKSGACKSSSHQLFKDRAKNRVDDLQGVFSDLQSARKESRSIDVAVLEEQVHQMLREWKSELNEPSPASSLQQGGSLGFSSEICRLLQLCEEEDDATSALAAPKPDPDAQKVVGGYTSQENFDAPKGPQDQGFQLVEQCKNAAMGVNMEMNNMNVPAQLDYHSFDFHQDFEQPYLIGFDGTGFIGEDVMPQMSGYQPNISPPPSAFLGPKCALWDCTRPALGLDWCQKSDDYCSIYHAGLAPSEGYLGRPPVVRPRGIGLKDNLLFAALGAKAQGKDVGIPECEGAATTKSPWNAPELFDLTVLDGETIREWLFFDKPRRAFESGNRKQRSLPDYNGRGWHESRKQVMNEFGGLKRSYYMDPQPMENFEWHLYEYEINKYDACALYRLEVKRVDGKKSPKGKLGNDSVADLQKQMGRLSAEFPNEKQRVVKGRGKSNLKEGSGRIYSGSNTLAASPGEGLDYTRGAPYDYLVEDINGYYIT